MAKIAQTFSISRKDLAFSFQDCFESLFLFSCFNTEPPTGNAGVRVSMEEGYDFRHQCSPSIELRPVKESELANTELTLSEIQVNISIFDRGLGMRKLLLQFPLSEITERRYETIDLAAHSDLAFKRGFEVSCFLSRTNSLKTNSKLLWHKSQIIFQREFVVMTSSDAFRFPHRWGDFKEEKNVLYRIDWVRTEIDKFSPAECFQIFLNDSLKDQLSQMQKHQFHGFFFTVLLANVILREVFQSALSLTASKTIMESSPESLLEVLENLFSSNGYDFRALAEKSQSPDAVARNEGYAELNTFIQKHLKIGEHLRRAKFGNDL